MPTYDYQCEICDYQTEIFQKITENPLKTCPKCEQESFQRGIGGGIGLSFKGSGFYITDYGQKKESPSSQEACPCNNKTETSCKLQS